ncbi:helix-turn-helix domain-containing protein [Mycobacterium avium]
MARRNNPAPKAASELPEFLTTAEVAALLRVSPKTVVYWRNRGEGPVSEKIMGNLRFPRAEFEQWLTEQRESARRGDGVKVAF